MFKRKKIKEQSNVPTAAQAKANALSVALAKFPPYEGVVHRGGQFPSSVIDQYVVGEAIQEPGFTSATSDPTKEFVGNTHFIIRSRDGKPISQFSAHPEEAEVVFDLGAAFMVCRNSYNSTVAKHEIVLDQIDAGWRATVLSDVEKQQRIAEAIGQADEFLATVAGVSQAQRTLPAQPGKFNTPIGVSEEGIPYPVQMPGE